MKIIFNRDELVKAFHLVAENVPRKPQNDILKNVLLEVTGDGVSLCSTDMETSIRCKVKDATATERGSGLIPAGRIDSILREMPDEHLEMRFDDSGVRIIFASGKFRLVSEDPKEFPPVPEFGDQNVITLPGQRLLTMIRQTRFATDADSTRYAIGGLLFEIDDKVLSVVATDSRRLAVTSTPINQVGLEQENKRLVVPQAACKLLASALAYSDEVSIAMKQNSVALKIGDATILSRIIEGRFPRYRAVIPQRFNRTVPLVGNLLASAIRQAMVVSSDEERGVHMTFFGGNLSIHSETANGEASVEIPIAEEGERISMKLDGKYILDFLKVVGESTVEMNILDGDTATMFTSGESYIYMVMPLTQD